MYHKVRIKKLPKAKSGYETNSLDKQSLTFGGADAAHYETESTEVRNTLGSVPRSEANLEAEGGETAYGDINGDGMPEHYKIKGPRHAQGGVPMNLPDGTFIFSDYVKLKIKDCNILKMFGKPCGKKKKGYTPAQLAKQYDMNKYRKVLEDAEASNEDRKTAELMIQKYVIKLAALALAQESLKGYPQGVPVVARPYLEHMGITEEDILGPSMETRQQLEQMTMQPPVEETPMEPMMQEGGFTPHMMYDPNTGLGFRASVPEDHIMMQEQGYVHEQPKARFGMQSGMPSGNLSRFIPMHMDSISIPTQTQPRMQKGGGKGLPKGAVIIDPDKYDTQQELLAAQREALKKSPDNVFVKREGKLYKVSQKPLAFEGDFATSSFNKRGVEGDEPAIIAGQYQAVVNTFNTPAGKKALQDKAIAALKNKDNVRGLSQSEVDAMIKKLEEDPDLAYNQFTEMQRRNLSLAANAVSVKDLRNNPDRGDYLNSDFREVFKEIGGDDMVPTKEEAAIQQATYIGYSNLLADRDAGKITDPEFNKALQDFSVSQVGASDDELTGTSGEGRISKIDGIYTNTTAGEIAGANAFTLSEDEFKIDPEDKEVDVNKRGEDNTLLPQVENYEAQWMTPDTLDYFAAHNQPINTYGAWAPLVDLPEVSPVYEDPTRAIAANNEALNMFLQQADQMASSPTTKLGNMAFAAGQSGRNAADIAAGIEGKNVAIANQSKQLNAQMKAEEDRINQGVTAQLYQQNNVLLPQAYDTAKAQKKASVLGAFGKGWHNASKLAGVNAMNPNYKINPITGQVMFIGNREVTPEKPGMTFEDALAKAQSMGLTDNAAVNAASKLMTQTAQQGGFVMGSNVFPFMFY